MDVLELHEALGEAEIEQLVRAFYLEVREHPRLGPIFASRIAADAWPAHLETMCRFWSTVLRGTGRYRGNPMLAHLSIEAARRHHFEDWLTLFGATARRLLSPAVAAAIEQRARRMGDRLQAAMGIARPDAPDAGKPA